MTRCFAAWVSLAATVVAAAPASTPQVGADACGAAVVMKGLGEKLDGEYFRDYGETYALRGNSNLALEYSCKTAGLPPNWGGSGCLGSGPCSAEDSAKAEGKWGIIAGDLQHYLYAVCEEGCPEVPRNSAGECLAQHPSWPAGSWSKPMKWRITNMSAGKPVGEVETSANANCCKLKPVSCDSCSASTCSGLIRFLSVFNHCPPNGGTWLQPLSEMQEACCETYFDSPLPVPPKCVCKSGGPRMICDSQEEEEIAVV